MTRLMLASQSPRRRELLSLLGIPFEVMSPGVDETRRPGEDPAAYVERLARDKAACAIGEGVAALGADTVVVHAGRILGKPRHPAEARATLLRLSGDTHHVVTGVAVGLLEEGRSRVETQVETALVRFAGLTELEVDAYVATGEPMDKAGSYALQERGGLLVETIEGHPSTVAGLPLPATRRLLTRFGFRVLA